MNWDAIGAIGEIIGALAVFLTLVYLATQIRQNTTRRFRSYRIEGGVTIRDLSDPHKNVRAAYVVLSCNVHKLFGACEPASSV